MVIEFRKERTDMSQTHLLDFTFFLYFLISFGRHRTFWLNTWTFPKTPATNKALLYVSLSAAAYFPFISFFSRICSTHTATVVSDTKIELESQLSKKKKDKFILKADRRRITRQPESKNATRSSDVSLLSIYI